MRKYLIRYFISVFIFFLLAGCSGDQPEAALATAEGDQDSVVEAQITEAPVETPDIEDTPCGLPASPG